MKFNITITNYNLKGKEEDMQYLIDLGFTINKDNGGYYKHKINETFIEKDLSFEDIIELSKHQEIIISGGNEIEIYNDYRE